jgi:hypothetical protein
MNLDSEVRPQYVREASRLLKNQSYKWKRRPFFRTPRSYRTEDIAKDVDTAKQVIERLIRAGRVLVDDEEEGVIPY